MTWITLKGLLEIFGFQVTGPVEGLQQALSKACGSRVAWRSVLSACWARHDVVLDSCSIFIQLSNTF